LISKLRTRFGRKPVPVPHETPAQAAPEESGTERATREHEAFEAKLSSASDVAEAMMRKVRDDASAYTEHLRALAAVHTEAADRIEHRFL
jgi:hypothetical protein